MVPTKTEQKKKNSVRNLASLYTVVIGVALSISIAQIVDPSTGLSDVNIVSILLFGAIISTLIPFYHGAMRHLDDSYIESDHPQIKDLALLVDVLLLFFHGIVFVVLALLLHNPIQFAWTLVVLLSIDVVWGAFVCFGPSASQEHSAEGKWGIINFVCVVLIMVGLVMFNASAESGFGSVELGSAICAACVLRSLVDYLWCREFYFPKES